MNMLSVDSQSSSSVPSPSHKLQWREQLLLTLSPFNTPFSLGHMIADNLESLTTDQLQWVAEALTHPDALRAQQGINSLFSSTQSPTPQLTVMPMLDDTTSAAVKWSVTYRCLGLIHQQHIDSFLQHIEASQTRPQASILNWNWPKQARSLRDISQVSFQCWVKAAQYRLCILDPYEFVFFATQSEWVSQFQQLTPDEQEELKQTSMQLGGANELESALSSEAADLIAGINSAINSTVPSPPAGSMPSLEYPRVSCAAVY